MKDTARSNTHSRAYPHLISLGAVRNTRWLIEMGSGPGRGPVPIAHAFKGDGIVNDAGEPTPRGRDVILLSLRRHAGRHHGTDCVVWGARECTFVMPDGTTVDGTRPPTGEPIYPEDYERVTAQVADVRYVRMPADSAVEYVCLRTIDAHHVEVSSGSPMILGCFDELPTSGPGSELRRHLDADGRLVAPKTFRGVRTTGVANGYQLLGPVQPDGDAIRIVEPWPQRVLAAAEEIAEVALPKKTRDAIWRAVDAPEDGMMLVGAVEVG